MFFISLSFYGQTLAVEGYVYDDKDKVPLSDVFIYFVKNDKVVYTGKNGYFSASLIIQKDSIKIFKEGYNQLETIISSNTSNFFYLREKVEELDAVVINSSNKNNSSKVELGDIVFYSKDLNKMPFILGEVDAIKLIQYTPGVQQAKEGQSGLLVRGGNGSMNLTLLDDIYIHNTAHIGGVISGINSDIIRKMTFSKAGFDAAYGGRLSSVTSIETPSNIESFQMDGSIGLLTSKVTLKSPIDKLNTSIILSGRRTYFDLLKPFFKGSNDNSLLSPEKDYFFYDYFAKTSTNLRDQDQINLLLYATKDFYNDQGENRERESHWSNLLYGVNWVHFFNDYFRSKTTVSKSNYNFHYSSNLFPYNYELNSYMDVTTLKEQFFLNSENHFMNFGVEYNYTNNLPKKIDLNILDSPIVVENQIFYETHDLSAYFNDKIEIDDKLKLKIGLRLTSFLNTTEEVKTRKGYLVVEPRISLNYKLRDMESIKFSYQRLHQFLHQASVSSLSLPVDFNLPSNSNLKPQLSNQFSMGYYLDKEYFHLGLTPYYNYISNYIEFKNGSINNLFNNNIYEDIIFGNIQSYGLEVSLKAERNKFNGTLSYTLSSTEAQFDEVNNGKSFKTSFDRPHNLNVILNYQLNSKIEFGALFVLTSGQNHTPPKDIRIVNEEAIINFASKNSSRYPVYHRLDLSCTYSIKETERWKSKLNFSIYNAYYNKNPFFIEYKINGDLDDNMFSVDLETQSLFPILPSVTWSFQLN